ncbi:septation protein SepH [Spirillospora sp. NPDC029432]|uniref:septation protein SepH n=1 Tax=Spirillospora sp. NPDC029432 TaxID=3154599 RepID=UPI0034562AA3
MQELRLVAVSEDGTYLVLATAGRGTRFTLPVDDRLRAAVRGHFSRLGQFEIEVESPLRPKEIQARIRSGETAEEIAESAGIPVERVRWFEGPVLQEREYMAQQAQRVAVRRPGESTPGPPLGETVEERLGRGGVDLEEVEWDSWKCEDSTWRVRLSFFDNGRPHAAEWVFDPRRRHVSPLDEVAARLTAVEWEDDGLGGDTVTPLVPRRPAMKVVSDSRDLAPPPPRGIGTPRSPEAPEPLRAATDLRREPPAVSRPPARPVPEAPAADEERSTPEPAAVAPVPVPRPAPDESAAETGQEPELERESAPEPVDEPAAEEAVSAPEPERESEPEAVPEPEAEAEAQAEREPEIGSEPENEPESAPEPVAEAAEEAPDETPELEAEAETEADVQAETEQAPETEAEREPEPAAEEAPAPEPEPEPEPAPEPEKPAAREKAQPAPKPQRPPHRETSRPPAKKKPSTARPSMPAAPVDPPAAAAAAAGEAAGAQRPARNRRKSKGKRASVPSWDEIMFGARRPD